MREDDPVERDCKSPVHRRLVVGAIALPFGVAVFLLGEGLGFSRNTIPGAVVGWIGALVLVAGISLLLGVVVSRLTAR